jgi:hypothetical protein
LLGELYRLEGCNFAAEEDEATLRRHDCNFATEEEEDNFALLEEWFRELIWGQ